VVRPGQLVDWVWTFRGVFPLPAGRGADQALTGIERVLSEPGTRVSRSEGAIEFVKAGQASLDPLASVDSGRIVAVRGKAGPALAYALVSRPLGACLVASLLFYFATLPTPVFHSDGRKFALVFLGLYAWGRVFEAKRIAKVLKSCTSSPM
jgi:hypothetical protein